MNTFAKSFLSLSLGLGLCAGAHAQSAPVDTHKAPVKVEAPKPVTAKTEAVKTEGKQLEAKAHDATKGKHAKAKPELAAKTPAAVKAPAVPEKPAVAPTAAKVLPKADAPLAKPAK